MGIAAALRRIGFVLLVAAGALAPAVAGQAPAAAAERVVMTWVPPYDRPASYGQLNSKRGGFGPSTALTHLGLQFWTPSADGGLERPTKFGAIPDAEVAAYVAWGKKNGVAVMLTVYNGVDGWDWALAKNAFGANRDKFVDALVAEMQRMKLDGVDVDLEGAPLDPSAEDKAAYVAFIRALSAKVRALGKRVQIDSFHYVYNAPNQTWWPDLFPLVDAIASMGYEDLGRSAPGWQAYAAQREAAGSSANMSKLIIGVPTYLDSWQGDAATTQIKWFADAKKRVGVGLWDARNGAEAFRGKPIWRALTAIRDQND